ncbi:Regulator of G-protein signaling 3 [Cichlidogyrus casuarinus]|uniref:Regulator of G-protein signaling 3 n=1 Tax=Cichlidogyrus casuarinus TaxID=1844966 RepID=A0ABD2PWP1_9PLAT
MRDLFGSIFSPSNGVSSGSSKAASNLDLVGSVSKQQITKLASSSNFGESSSSSHKEISSLSPKDRNNETKTPKFSSLGSQNPRKRFIYKPAGGAPSGDFSSISIRDKSGKDTSTEEPGESLPVPPGFKSLSVKQINRWERSFDALLTDECGLYLFNEFLKTEFSQENIQFWMACEAYKHLSGPKLNKEAQRIYRTHLSVQSPKEVNLDSRTRLQTIASLSTPNRLVFDSAQKKIQGLMEKDSYRRFLRSNIYLDLKKNLDDGSSRLEKANSSFEGSLDDPQNYTNRIKASQ